MADSVLVLPDLVTAVECARKRPAVAAPRLARSYGQRPESEFTSLSHMGIITAHVAFPTYGHVKSRQVKARPGKSILHKS